MVYVERDNDRLRLTLKPNRSLSWRGNQMLILSMMILSGGIAIGFAILGVWVIFFFVGIELALLSYSLYYVSWKLSYCHVLEVSENKVSLQKGVYYPKQSWDMALKDSTVGVLMSQHEWDGPSVTINHCSHRIALGDFLNKEEKSRMLSELRNTKLGMVYSSPS